MQRYNVDNTSDIFISLREHFRQKSKICSTERNTEGSNELSHCLQAEHQMRSAFCDLGEEATFSFWILGFQRHHDSGSAVRF